MATLLDGNSVEGNHQQLRILHCYPVTAVGDHQTFVVINSNFINYLLNVKILNSGHLQKAYFTFLQPHSQVDNQANTK
jgi:uncharacterized membrane protein